MKTFRQPTRSPLLRFIARVLIVAFAFALLPPSPTQAARTDVEDLARALPAPTPSPLAAPAEPHPVLWLVIAGQGEDLQAWFVVPDPELAGNYHRARWIDPSAGRFVGMDPWRGSPFEPATIHKYLYAASAPADLVDPTGLFNLSTALTTVTLVLRVAAIGLNIYGAAKNTSAAIIYSSLALQSFGAENYEDGLGFLGYAALRLGLAALNAVGLKYAIAGPPPFTGGLTPAPVVGGGAAFLDAAVAVNPAFVAWTVVTLGAAVSAIPTQFMAGDGMPRDHKKANKQVHQAFREAERRTGVTLDPEKKAKLLELLHEETKFLEKGGYHELVELATNLILGQ